MNELLNTEAEELGSSLHSSRSQKKKDGESLRTGSDDATETINVHIDSNVKNSDDLLKMCGDAGAWQILIFFLASICGFNCAIQNFLYIFIADTPEYWCSYPDLIDLDNYQEEDLKSILLPWDRELGRFQKCSRYQTEVDEGFIISIDNYTVETCNTEAIPIQYEPERFAETIGTEWSLVCNQSFWLPAVEAIYMVGVLVGSIVFGILSDKIGRRPTIWIACFMFVVFAPAIAFSNNFVTLLAFRFLLGMASPGMYSTSYVLVVETIGAHRRALAGLLFSVPYSIGYMVVPIIAYFIRDWRNLQLTCAALTPLVILTWWFLPESPRWLLIKGKVSRAEELLRKIASVNGKELPDDFHDMVKKVARAEKKSNKDVTCDQNCRNCMSGCCKLMTTPVIRYRVFCMSIAFLAVSLIYYGIAINPTNLGLDRYLFTFLCGLFEIPAEILIAVLIERNGRRMVFSGFFLICGTILLLSLPLPKGSIFDMVIFVSAQLFIAGNSTLIYLYSSELFPTEVRGYCLGITSMIGRIGSIAVPYIVELVGERHPTYPTIIFGAVALIAGTFSLLLPETRNKKLPETVAEVEKNRNRHHLSM